MFLYKEMSVDIFFQRVHYKATRNMNSSEIFKKYCPDWASENTAVEVITADKLIEMSEPVRITLLIINIVFMIVAVLGNSAVLFVNFFRYTHSKRNLRHLYKCCLVSLAFSDLVMGGLSGSTHIAALSTPYYVWHMGSFLCSWTPYILITALLANSLTLTLIAVDRYRTIVRHHPPPKNEPKTWTCVTIVLSIWMFGAVLSYPMLSSYCIINILAAFVSPDQPGLVEDWICAQRCYTLKKHQNFWYLGGLVSFIFLPLLFAFLFIYIHIAVLVWVRRKPPGSNLREASSMATESQTDEQSNDKKMPNGMNNNDKTKHIAVIDQSAMISKTSAAQMKQRTNVQMEKKIRTFKIIVLIIIVFFVCRLPNWIFMIVQMVFVLPGPAWWIVQYVLIALTLLNSAVNPFLYMFLNDTIEMKNKMSNYFSKNLIRSTNSVLNNDKAKA